MVGRFVLKVYGRRWLCECVCCCSHYMFFVYRVVGGLYVYLCMSVCLSVCLFLCLFVFSVRFSLCLPVPSPSISQCCSTASNYLDIRILPTDFVFCMLCSSTHTHTHTHAHTSFIPRPQPAITCHCSLSTKFLPTSCKRWPFVTHSQQTVNTT